MPGSWTTPGAWRSLAGADASAADAGPTGTWLLATNRHRTSTGTLPVRIWRWGEPLEFPLPPALLRLLDLYLGRHRHLLRGKDEGWLFPGEKGGPKHAVSLAGQIKRAVRHRAGLEVHPHLFRHIAAKLLL